MAAVKFKVGTYENYSKLASKDTNTLYFITDAKRIFKGSIDVTESIEIVSSNFPAYADAFEGKLYIKSSTLEVKIKESGKEALTTLVPGYVTTAEGVIAANNDKIPTVSALIAYVGAQFTAKTTLADYGITDAKIENSTITLGSNSITTASTSADGLMSKGDYDKLNTNKNAANGAVILDANGLVPTTVLPSFVDDVLEGYYKSDDGKFYKTKTASGSEEPITYTYSDPYTAEAGKIYVDVDTKLIYRYAGSQAGYVEISKSLAIGTTAGTAFDGKDGYDHVNDTNNPHGVTKSQVGLGNVTNDAQVKAIQSSTSGDVVTFGGTDGATISDSGKTIKDSGTMGNASTDIPTANVVASAISAAIADKVDEITATQGDIIVAGSDGAIADSSVQIAKYNATSYATMGTNNDKVPTEKLVSDAIDTKATNILGNGTADQVVTSTTTGVQRSGKAIGGATLASTTDANTLATEAAVDAAVSSKANKLTSSASTHVLVGSSTGDLADSSKTIGGATLASTPDSNTLATEAAVDAAITAAVSWESI